MRRLTCFPCKEIAMLIGKKVPQVTFRTRVRDESVGGPNPYRWQDVTSDDYFKGKRVILFSLPGAFTPTCSTYAMRRSSTTVRSSSGSRKKASRTIARAIPTAFPRRRTSWRSCRKRRPPEAFAAPGFEGVGRLAGAFFLFSRRNVVRWLAVATSLLRCILKLGIFRIVSSD